MSQFWTERTHALHPYVPGEQRQGDRIIKLNTNENPYPPSDKVLAAIAAVSGDALRRYPDPGSRALCEALAERHQLSVDEVFVGNGSDEVLALAFQAFYAGCKGLLFPDITYSFYPVYCELFDIEPSVVSLDEHFRIDTAAYAGQQGRGIVLPNPNAPTGIALTRGQISELLTAHPDKLVLIDEAYAGYGAESVVDLVPEFENLLVVQTFSKNRSLAGLRLGAAFGQKPLIDGLLRVKDSFNSYPVDVVASAAGLASLADESAHQQNLERVIATRSRLVAALEQREFQVLPSAANFVFARPARVPAQHLFNQLSAEGILVRYWDRPRLADGLRISIGTDEEIDALLSAIDRAAA